MLGLNFSWKWMRLPKGGTFTDRLSALGLIITPNPIKMTRTAMIGDDWMTLSEITSLFVVDINQAEEEWKAWKTRVLAIYGVNYLSTKDMFNAVEQDFDPGEVLALRKVYNPFKLIEFIYATVYSIVSLLQTVIGFLFTTAALGAIPWMPYIVLAGVNLLAFSISFLFKGFARYHDYKNNYKGASAYRDRAKSVQDAVLILDVSLLSFINYICRIVAIYGTKLTLLAMRTAGYALETITSPLSSLVRSYFAMWQGQKLWAAFFTFVAVVTLATLFTAFAIAITGGTALIIPAAWMVSAPTWVGTTVAFVTPFMNALIGFFSATIASIATSIGSTAPAVFVAAVTAWIVPAVLSVFLRLHTELTDFTKYMFNYHSDKNLGDIDSLSHGYQHIQDAENAKGNSSSKSKSHDIEEGNEDEEDCSAQVDSRRTSTFARFLGLVNNLNSKPIPIADVNKGSRLGENGVTYHTITIQRKSRYADYTWNEEQWRPNWDYQLSRGLLGIDNTKDYFKGVRLGGHGGGHGTHSFGGSSTSSNSGGSLSASSSSEDLRGGLHPAKEVTHEVALGGMVGL